MPDVFQYVELLHRLHSGGYLKPHFDNLEVKWESWRQVQLKPGEKKCLKCGGTGRWCLGIINGKPFSNTGFDCWSCDGTGVSRFNY